MKAYILFLISICLSATGALADEQEVGSVAWSCELYKDGKAEAAMKGQISRENFGKWLNSDYHDSGSQFSIPEDAIVMGHLLIEHELGILSMPIARWKGHGKNVWACRAESLAKPPRFKVFDDGKKSFLKSLKERLKTMAPE